MKETKCTWVGQITKSPTAARGLLCEVKTSRDVEPLAQPAGLLNLVSRTEGEPLGSGKVTRGEYFFFLQIFNRTVLTIRGMVTRTLNRSLLPERQGAGQMDGHTGPALTDPETRL